MGSGGKPRGASRLVLGIVAALLLVPVVVALASPHLAGAPPMLLVATSTGVLALGLLVVEVILPGRPQWLVRAAGVGLLRLHRAIALAVVGLVLLHVGALFVYSPSDTLFALAPTAPTHSRLGAVALFCLALTVALALGWRRLGLGRPEWRALHLSLAVAILITAFAHAVMVYGALDGPLGTLLIYAGAAVAGASVVYTAISRLRDRPPSRRGEPGAGDSSS